MKDEQIEHWKKIVKTQEDLRDLLNKVCVRAAAALEENSVFVGFNEEAPVELAFMLMLRMKSVKSAARVTW